MGNSSNTANPPNFEVLCKKSEINPKLIRNIYNNFLELDTSGKGYVSVDDFCRLEQINKNPLKSQICNFLTRNSKQMDKINFEDFLILLDTFQNKPIFAQKKLLFNICDLKSSGVISKTDFMTILSLLVGKELSENNINEITSKLLSDFTFDKQNITYEDFLKILE